MNAIGIIALIIGLIILAIIILIIYEASTNWDEFRSGNGGILSKIMHPLFELYDWLF